MIAYFILVHRYPEQFKRLFKAIYHPENQYLIHIDKKSPQSLHDSVTSFLEVFSNVHILKSQNVLWGGYSMVDVELKAIKIATKNKQKMEVLYKFKWPGFSAAVTKKYFQILRKEWQK